MTIYKKRIKLGFKLFIIVLCLFLGTITIMGCSNKTGKITNENKENILSKDDENKDEKQIASNTKVTKIAFEKDNNVYIYDEINEQIRSLGDNSKLKDLLNLSLDKTKIMFRYFNEGKAIYPPHVIVYDIKTKSLTDIVIENKNVQQIVELEWLDNENVLVTGHINPSASGYAVYNIKNSVQLISCVGTIRDVTIDKKNILYSDTPHIFPQLKANLYINGNKIFETDSDKEEIFDGVISKDGKILAFRSWMENEKNLNGEPSAYLNVAKINSDGKSISDLKKISINSDTIGNIKFDDKNNISIIGEEFIYKLKEDNLIKEQNDLPKPAEISIEQLKKFKRILARQFPEEFISEKTLLEDINIYNMIAF